MFGSSMIMTIGQALERARLEGASVEINVAGVWITGHVVNADSQAVVVSNGRDEVSVLRLEAVTCVRMTLAAGEERARPQGARPAPAPGHHLTPVQREAQPA